MALAGQTLAFHLHLMIVTAPIRLHLEREQTTIELST